VRLVDSEAALRFGNNSELNSVTTSVFFTALPGHTVDAGFAKQSIPKRPVAAMEQPKRARTAILALLPWPWYGLRPSRNLSNFS
jgi:hypothetical protein